MTGTQFEETPNIQKLKVMSLIPQVESSFHPRGNKNKTSCLFVFGGLHSDLEGQALNSRAIVQHHSSDHGPAPDQELGNLGSLSDSVIDSPLGFLMIVSSL